MTATEGINGLFEHSKQPEMENKLRFDTKTGRTYNSETGYYYDFKTKTDTEERYVPELEEEPKEKKGVIVTINREIQGIPREISLKITYNTLPFTNCRWETTLFIDGEVAESDSYTQRPSEDNILQSSILPKLIKTDIASALDVSEVIATSVVNELLEACKSRADEISSLNTIAKVKAKKATTKPDKGSDKSTPEGEATLNLKETNAKDGKKEKAVEVQTSNKSVRFLLKYSSEKWTTQISYNLNYIYPPNSSKVPIFEENTTRENKLLKLFAEKTKIGAGEAKRLLSELVDASGKHTDEIMSLMEESEEKLPTLEEMYPAEIIKTATEILKTGDAFKFFMDTWKKSYAVMKHKVTNEDFSESFVEDDSIGAMTLCVIGSTLISNSEGLHEKVGGSSGFGKSFGVASMFNLFPPEKTFVSSMSPKSLFYMPLPAGTVVYYDDFDLTKRDIYTTIKQSTSSYQEATNHITVVNGAPLACVIKERIGWILSAVDNFDDEQMDSRFGETEVNDSIDMQHAIHGKQEDEEFSITKSCDVDKDTLTCRCIWSLLEAQVATQGLYEVRISFVKAINWWDIKHPRSFPFFKDIIRVMALFKILQREKVNDYYVATTEDFHSAEDTYSKMAKINSTKLNTKELHILQYLGEQNTKDSIFTERVTRMDLVEYLGKTYGMKQNNIIDIIHGKNDSRGLLNKVAGLQAEKLRSDSYNTQWNYWYAGGITKDGYAKIITIDEDKAKTEMQRWRETIK